MKSVKIYLENAAAAEAFVQTMRQFEGEDVYKRQDNNQRCGLENTEQVIKKAMHRFSLHILFLFMVCVSQIIPHKLLLLRSY